MGVIKKNMVDVHVVAQTLPRTIISQLEAIGFSSIPVVGGDARVRMDHLLSLKVPEVSCADSAFIAASDICSGLMDFSGYIEEEIVAEDLVLAPSLNVATIPSIGVKLEAGGCPPHLFKQCDIHIAGSMFMPGVQNLLEDAGFYHLVLDKPGLGGHVRVYTMQFEEARHGRQVWRRVRDFFSLHGGIRGHAKLEVTRKFRRWGDYALPPLVRSCKPPMLFY